MSPHEERLNLFWDKYVNGEYRDEFIDQWTHHAEESSIGDLEKSLKTMAELHGSMPDYMLYVTLFFVAACMYAKCKPEIKSLDDVKPHAVHLMNWCSVWIRSIGHQFEKIIEPAVNRTASGCHHPVSLLRLMCYCMDGFMDEKGER
jgi:hypothetical protein